MKLFYLIIAVVILLNLNTITADPVVNDYGIVNAWYNGQEATVKDVQLKVGEPVEITVFVQSNTDCHVFIELINPLVTMPYDVVSGPSEFDNFIDVYDVKTGWRDNFTWIIKPNGEWVNGNAPINIFVQFSNQDESQYAKFTIANPIILDEHYSGPTRTTTDPSSTNQSPSQGSPGFGVAGALLGILLAIVYRAGRG